MRRALGKGLTQLLGEDSDAPTSEVSIDAIRANPRQPRRVFASEPLQELADSIRTHGVIQPLVVRTVGPNKFELIAGERRLRAAALAGLLTVPVVVRDASAQVSLELALVENVQREDINPIECALAYRKLSDEFGLTQEQVANKVGKSRVSVSNAMRLLKLPETIQDALSENKISEGHAKVLLMVDSPGKLLALFERIVSEGLSVRETERLARGEARTPKAPSEKPTVDPDWDSLARKISEHFGAKIKLDRKSHGGRLSIEYFSDDELEGILEKMGVKLVETPFGG